MSSEDEGNRTKFSKFKFWCNYTKTNLIVLLMLLAEPFHRIFITLFCLKRPKSVENKIACITGGGHGIGRALAYQLAEKGCKIAIADINYAAAFETAQEIKQKFKVEAAAFQTDVSKYEEVEKMKKEIESTLGFVDILINNAGVLSLDLSLMEKTPNELQRVIDINLMSHFWTVRAFLDGMVERKYGHIVAVSSLGGIISIPNAIAYSTSKFGVTGFMSALFDELCVYNYDKFIKTTTFFPIFVNTNAELMKMIGNNPSYSPNTAAKALVKGILLDERNVYLPSYASSARITNSLPDKVVRYIKVSNFDKKMLKKRNDNVV